MESAELQTNRGRGELKLDLYKQFKSEYAARRTPALVTVKAATYLAIAGAGSPQDPPFQAAIGAMYAVAFTIKMARKFAGRDYAVAKLEGLWWGGEPGKLIIDSRPETWRWKIMIRVPDFITARDRSAALAVLAKRGKGPLPARVKLETLTEGRCVQMLHVGGYDAEGPTIAAMDQCARAAGLRFTGRHHEIYLSDPRRVPAERLRTILRHPVRKV